ncbi:HAD-IA family hydrolase [Porticoccus litoralis]|uniref:HAD-IA family hydrolase n=1 Tax=Porticoccus litoralis TaxID=434086 RepID=A0AAW8B005_9GAMM|nr:HAD-IA family hydrolase [Porticoccus litoralis]MDP1519427.1 HAD-IA family hydrolase [Porticoccus litoralis]
MAKLLVFDWDGTLCDSLSRIVTCICLAAEETGLPAPHHDAARDIVGLGLVDALETLFPGIDREHILTMRDSYSRHFAEQDREPSPFFDGVMETLELLLEQGYVLTVATGKSRRGLDRVLKARGLNDFFHGSRCADETAGKPDPKMLLELMSEFQTPPEQTIMVGDTEFDLAMAVSAGVPRIAVSYGAHHPDRLQKYQPLACIDQFSLIDDVVNIYKKQIYKI